MGMSFTDVIMIGWLGTTELAASAATSDFHSLLFYIGAGIISSTSVFIAQARGKNQPAEIVPVVQQGMVVAVICSIPASAIIYNASFVLSLVGVDQSIVDHSAEYAQTLCFAFLPMMLMTVFHHFIAAHDKTRIILIVTIAGLPLNALLNYFLLFGNYGFPELKLAGAGIATSLTAGFMLLCLIAYSRLQPGLKTYRIFSDFRFFQPRIFKDILKVGTPIGISNIGEMGVFLTSTIIIGVFGAETLAAHTIALRLAGLFYAFPLGLSQAATIRCGYLIGEKNLNQLKTSIKVSIVMALLIGFLFLLIIWFFNKDIATLFLPVNENTQSLLLTAAGFLLVLGIIQPFDGLATVVAGILRGMKDTRIPMMLSIGSYWLIGFSSGMLLAFYFGYDGIGIWSGLAIGATIFGITTTSRLTILWRENFHRHL